MNGIGHNSFFARMRNCNGIEANMTGVSMYEVWFEAKTATGYRLRFSAPSTVSLDLVTHKQARAQTLAIRCCAYPFLSTSETSSERVPQSAVITANRGVWMRLVRQR
jgi:hypothetical protein